MTALTAQLTNYPFTAQLGVDLAGETEGNRQWEILGSTLDGSHVWEVRGGKGLVRDGNIILLDPDVPLETPVRWTLITPRGRYSTSPLVVAGPGKGRGVFSTTSTREPIVFKWLHTLDEQEIKPRFERFSVQGRSRMPVRRDEVADAGGGTLVARTQGVYTQCMVQAILMNEPLTIRTHGYMIDWPLVEHIDVNSAPFALAEKILARDWSIDYTLSDFYAFSARMAPPVTVGETAALGLTVGQVTATGLTVGQVAAGGLMS